MQTAQVKAGRQGVYVIRQLQATRHSLLWV